MTAQHLEAKVRYQSGLAIIDLHGDIDSFAEEILNTIYNEVTQAKPAAILLNFTHVGYINSTGLALIVSLLAKIRQSQRRILSCGLSNHYAKIFQITHLADVTGIFPDETSALAALKLG